MSLALSSLSFLALLGGCSPTMDGPTNLVAAVDATSFPAPDSSRSNAVVGQTDYRIAPQDLLEISVYQVPTLNRAVQVDGAGRLSLPLIGSVAAGGRTARELEIEIAAKLSARYMQSPQVGVFVKEAVGQRVTIDGAVKKPGIIALKGQTTLLQILAQAEGLNDVADLGKVTVFRVADQRRVSNSFDVAAIREGRAPDPLVYGGDTIVVDESLGLNTWKAFKDTIIVPASLAARSTIP